MDNVDDIARIKTKDGLEKYLKDNNKYNEWKAKAEALIKKYSLE